VPQVRRELWVSQVIVAIVVLMVLKEQQDSPAVREPSVPPDLLALLELLDR